MNIVTASISFSVLLPVYFKERADYLALALNSIWDDQTLKPSEIVIVKDGPLTEELDKVIDEFSVIAPVKCLVFETNRGLGFALAEGLDACSNEIVARMDSDDIAVPTRFEKQVSFLINRPDIDILSSNIAEFNESPNDIVSYRNIPESPEVLRAFAKRRCPVNHMAVVFRKSAVMAAGNYLPFRSYEDYYLWIRMLSKGSAFYNIQENLILARIGNNMLSRRQGRLFFKQEIKLQQKFFELGFINRSEFFINIILRAIPRLMPVWMLQYVYKILRR